MLAATWMEQPVFAATTLPLVVKVIMAEAPSVTVLAVELL